jgi:hypothetical protein
MKPSHHLLRKLIREVIEESDTITPSTSTQPGSSQKDSTDGGNDTTTTPEKAVEDYFSSTKGAIETKREDEAIKLASTLKQGGIDTPDKVMSTLKNLERDEDGGQSFADEIIKYQTTAEGRKFGKSRR